MDRGAKLTTALQFLYDNAEAFSRAAPTGDEDQWRASWWFMPTEPTYSWPTYYGDFSPLTLRAAVKRGFVENERYHRNWFRLTDLGRIALNQNGRAHHG